MLEQHADKSPPLKRQKSGEVQVEPICIVHVQGLQYGDLKLLTTVNDPEERLSRLHDICKRRRAQPEGSILRMDDTCSLIPDVLLSHHGYHQVCYQRFAMNLTRLKDVSETSEVAKCDAPTVCRRAKDHIQINADCIFCRSDKRKKIKVKGCWSTEGMTEFDKDGWRNVVAIAEKKQDEELLIRIQGQDVLVCAAKFHKSCRNSYIQNPVKWRSSNLDMKESQSELEKAHKMAFHCICLDVDQRILCERQIIKLTHFVNMYVSELAKSDFRNTNFRGENLKIKLEKHYGDRVSFCSLGNFKSYIVYSSQIDTHTAVRYSYELGSKDMLEETGLHLKKDIQSAFKDCAELQWPPSASDLAASQDVIPTSLEKLLSFIVTGQSSPTNAKTKRLVLSIGQDICRAATNGEWKLPKHLLLCMTLRHMFRSEQLLSMLNRLGHSESYSFSLELETAQAEVAEKSSQVLSSQIVRNPGVDAVLHSEFDNFDQMINNITGSGSVHTAHGIMLQEVSCDNAEKVDAPTVNRTKRRSLELEQAPELPECYVTQRKSPKVQIQQKTYEEGPPAQEKSRMRQTIWLISRLLNQDNQLVPSWSGFISETGNKPDKLTIIAYYPVIPKPITEYRTVQECLRYAEVASKEVGQTRVLTTFDMGVCMKAYPLIWNDPAKYDKHVVLIGTFHLICAYLRVIGKKMAGSGLSDIFLEAGLITSGSLDGVLSGKNYERAMHCHKVMLECLEQLLFEKFVNLEGEENSIPPEAREKIQHLVEAPCEQNQTEALDDTHLKSYIERYMQFRSRVAEGSIGKTAQFWVSYMDHIRLVLSLLEAVKDNNFFLYAHTLQLMTDLFFSFNGQNYARYLTYFAIFLANVDVTDPEASQLIKKGAFSVARSFIPGNRCDVDKTMEETFMRHAKSRGGAGSGVTGLLNNFDAYQRWVRSTHARSQYVDAMLQLVGLQAASTDGKHRETRPAEMRRSTSYVLKTKDAVNSFINPFDADTEELVNLSSGAIAPIDVSTDVLRAESVGNVAKEEFVTDRLQNGKDFFDPIKRIKLKTMNDLNTSVKATTSKNKIVQFKQQGNVAFKLFVQVQNIPGLKVDLRELLAFPLTPVPYSLATADGFFAKTDKSKAFHHIVKGVLDSPAPPRSETLTIHDGNAVFYCMKDVPSTFRLVCQKIFNMMAKGDVIFSTDCYHADSIKAVERHRRGTTEKLIIKGENTKVPRDWKGFLANTDNKKQFVDLLLREWSKDEYASKLHGRNVTLVCDGQAYHLTSSDGQHTERTLVEALQSSQEETDTRIVLYCKHAQSKGYKTCRVKSPDTDVFFILLFFVSQMNEMIVLFDTGTGNKQKLLNITQLAENYDQGYRSALLALHAFSGCDTTSAFKGIGKVKPIKTLNKMPGFSESFSTLGDTWSVRSEVVDDLESFTCALYGKGRLTNVDTVRFMKMNDMFSNNMSKLPTNFDLGNFPPCRKSLVQHIRRVNFQVGIWKRALTPNPEVPSPEGHGWAKVDDTLEPLWYNGTFLPQQLIDLADSASFDSDESDSDSDFEDNPMEAARYMENHMHHDITDSEEED